MVQEFREVDSNGEKQLAIQRILSGGSGGGRRQGEKRRVEGNDEVGGGERG
jgi:hypothetical protein